MADHFEEVVQLRLSALETRVDVEVEAVQEHFAEMQQFITFSLERQAERLRVERREDLKPIEQRLDVVERGLDGVEQRLDGVEQRLGGVEQRLDGVEQRLGVVEQSLGVVEYRLDGNDRRMDAMDQRFDRLEARMDAHHDATQTALAEIRDIVKRLPGAQ